MNEDRREALEVLQPAFVVLDELGRRSRAAPPKAVPRRRRRTPPWIPELRTDDEPYLEISLSSVVRSEVGGEISEYGWALERDGETGGWIFGAVSLRRAELVHASGPGRGARRRHKGMALDLSEIERVERMLSADGSSNRHIGDWHVHPSGTRPSEQDMMAWLSFRDLYRCSRYIGVIATPHKVWRWDEPIFTAWAVRRELGPGRLPVCEPVRICSSSYPS